MNIMKVTMPIGIHILKKETADVSESAIFFELVACSDNDSYLNEFFCSVSFRRYTDLTEAEALP